MILWGFRKNEQGVVVSKLFDSDNFPAGWFDSPDKIEPTEQKFCTPCAPLPVEPAKGHCPKCGKHIGRGIGFHKKRCEG